MCVWGEGGWALGRIAVGVCYTPGAWSRRWCGWSGGEGAGVGGTGGVGIAPPAWTALER